MYGYLNAMYNADKIIYGFIEKEFKEEDKIWQEYLIGSSVETK